jgi:sulfate-transporting ATPase
MQVVLFALLGVATGGLYAVMAQGLVVVYRGTGVLNFAQGGTAMFGAYAYYDLAVRQGLPKPLAGAAALIMCALLGTVIYLVVLRPMRSAAPLSRVMTTLGIVLILESAASLLFGDTPLLVPSLLPTGTVHITSSLAISQDRIWIFGISVALSAAMYFGYRYTGFGRATLAVAENEVAAASFGISPDLIGAANWALGSIAAGVAGILIAPIIYLDPSSLVLLVIPAMAAGLIGEFVSFPLTFAAAVAIGIAESELQRYVSQPGWPTAVPYLLVILVLVVRGRGIPLRSFVAHRMPSVGTGQVRPLVVIALWAVAVWFAMTSDANWSDAIVATFGVAIVCLSVVVLTGYTGQLSLAQYVTAGIAALVAARLAQHHVPFLAALVLAALFTAVVGGLVGIPALRTRGVTLAVATLGLAGALEAVVLANSRYTGGVTGIMVPSPTLFGWSLDPLAHPDRYAAVTISAFVLLALAVANLRRGHTGRQLLAVRSNERAAASLGVNVAWVKTYAFMLGSGIAGVGGVLLVFIQPYVQPSSFDVFTCILVVAVTVTAGVGYIPAALLGALLVGGGVVSTLLFSWSSVNSYLPLIGGVLLVVTLIVNPNGLFETARLGLSQAISALPVRGRNRRRAARRATLERPSEILRAPARALSVRNVSVSFGGVKALQDVSIDVHPGQVHGVIGPNGAGKTTLVDAITGFTRTTQGTVRLGDVGITGWSVRRRARAGMSRSFQSLELFSDLTVLENLAVASERPSALRYLLDLLHPRSIRLSQPAVEALHQFDLIDHVDVRPRQVSLGRRKIIAIARAVASSPSVLLLDEPAAGLDDHEVADLSHLIRHLADSWGVAVLLIEHRVDMILAISDHVTVLDGGRVLASGAPGAILSDQLVIDAYLGSAPDQTARQLQADLSAERGR